MDDGSITEPSKSNAVEHDADTERKMAHNDDTATKKPAELSSMDNAEKSAQKKNGKPEKLPFADNLRAAFSRSSTVAALRTRKIPATYAKFPHIHQYLVRGRYANDLMRIDDFISSITKQDIAVENDKRLDNPVTRKSRIPFLKSRVVTEDWARVLQLLQEAVLHAHIAVEDRRIMEQSIEHDARIDMLVHFRKGNAFWSMDDVDPAGVSARFTVIYNDGALYESFIYIQDGTFYVTQMQLMESMEPDAVDTREWPEKDSLDPDLFVTIDETYTRFVGSYLISKPGDSLDGRFWLNTSDTERDIHERLAPLPEEGTTEQIMDRVSIRSLFVANYGALEAVVLALFFVFITSVAWKPGVGWTVIPLLLGGASLAVMAMILRKILDTTLTADIMVAKQKPDLNVWRISQIIRVLLTLVAALIVMLGASMVTLRIEEKDFDDLSFETLTTLFPIAAALAIAAWHITARRVRVPVNMMPVTDSMRTAAMIADFALAAVLSATAVVLYISGTIDSWLHLTIFSAVVLVSFPMVMLAMSRLIGSLTPLRSLENARYCKYVHNDSGLTRAQWTQKYDMAP